MEKLFDWIRNITYYLIFITVVINLLPNKKYEKYIRLFAGMVLILLVLKPITGGLRLEDTLARYFEEISLQKEAGELTGKFSAMDEKRLEAMISGYENAVAVDLKSMAETAGFVCKEVTAKIDKDQNSPSFGKVMSVSLILTPKETAEETKSGISVENEAEPVKKVPDVDGVKIGETKPQKTEKGRQEENSQLSGLRRRIIEYYDLEEQEIEIQVEDGKG